MSSFAWLQSRKLNDLSILAPSALSVCDVLSCRQQADRHAILLWAGRQGIVSQCISAHRIAAHQ